LPASSLVGGRIGDDLDERVLNSILKGRTVGRIGPLGMIGSFDTPGKFAASFATTACYISEPLS
jgi:hypothetical protein